MTHAELIDHYFKSDRAANEAKQAGSLSYNGDKLYSYSTAIGLLIADTYVAVQKRYSKTTTVHQNKAMYEARVTGRRIVLVRDDRELDSVDVTVPFCASPTG
jgi:hypothetical protein